MRTETITYKIYKFDELSEDAQQRVIQDRQRDPHYLDYPWWDFLYEDAKEIAGLFGLEIDKIYFSGFWNQGDGACFTGTYRYKAGGLKAVEGHAPDHEVLRIVKGLQDVQQKYFYRLTATIRHSGRYYHEYCATVDVSYDLDETREILEVEEEITTLLRDYMRWIYRSLEKEYWYLLTEKAIKEHVVANDYEYHEDGKVYF